MVKQRIEQYPIGSKVRVIGYAPVDYAVTGRQYDDLYEVWFVQLNNDTWYEEKLLFQ